MKKNVVIITGVNGFIGSSIAKKLYRNYFIVGIDKHDFDQFDSSDKYFKIILPSNDIANILVDFKPTYCVHCAGLSSVSLSFDYPELDFKSGPDSVFNLVDSIYKTNSDCKVIFISSAAVYGNPLSLPVDENHPQNPISPYGYHKMISEKILQEYMNLFGINSIVLRVFSCYGNGMKKQLLWDIVNKIFKDGFLELSGTGKETRDFINIIDLVNFIDLIIKKKIKKGIFNVGTGQEVKIEDIATLVLRNLSLLKWNVVFSQKNRSGDPDRWVADIKKSCEIGFKKMIDLELGIQSYCNWVRNEFSK